MNTTNKNYRITRRDALRTLAQLPFATLGLSIPGSTVVPARYGDALAYCTAALEGCWALWGSSDSGDIRLAFQSVSSYLPILKTIMKDSAVYREEALYLAAQYALLRTLLGRVCIGLTESMLYAEDAKILCKETGDISLQLSAYTVLGWSYFYSGKYTQAQVVMQKGEAVLLHTQRAQHVPSLPSHKAGSFYSCYALVQTRNGQSPDKALGIATDSEPGERFTRSTQLREAALICCLHGDHMQALKWLEKRIDLETLAPRYPQNERGRLETINILVRSLLKSKERDMERIIHHWTIAIEGANALGHELAFNQAIANFEGLEYAFPDEKRIQDLRPLAVHWNTAM